MNRLYSYAVLIFFLTSWHGIQASEMFDITNEAVNLGQSLVAESEKKFVYTHFSNVTDRIKVITEIYDAFLNKTQKMDSTFKGLKCNVTQRSAYSDLISLEHWIKKDVSEAQKYVVHPFLRTNLKLNELFLEVIMISVSESTNVGLRKNQLALHESLAKREWADRISLLDYITNKTQTECKGQSPQYILYNTVFNIALLDARAYGLLQYSYAFTKIMHDAYARLDRDVAGSFLLFDNENRGQEYFTKMKQQEQPFVARNIETFKVAKPHLSTLPRVYWFEEPNKIVDLKTKLKVFQNYIVNEVDLSPDKSCSKDCPHFGHGSQVQGCFDNQICAKQRVCEGKLWNCYEESKITICPAGKEDKDLRYEYLDIKKKRYGENEDARCRKEIVEAKTWQRFLYKCSNCMCVCEASNRKIERYFSLRPVLSDADLNFVVTGMMFEIKNQIIHIRIKQEKILPRGFIENPVTYFFEGWKEVDDLDVNDKDLIEGTDYHVLSWQNRTVCTDEFDSLNKSHVLTGIRFKSEPSVDGQSSCLKLEIRLTPYDFTTGRLSNEKSYWYSNNAKLSDRTEFKLDDSMLTDAKPDGYFKFTTSLQIDAGQSTVPIIEREFVKTAVSVPLSGAAMVWTPADISETCYLYPSVASCQSSMLAFIALVTQYFGQSHVYSNPYKENEDYILSQTYDFIVVGAGSAGCVVANRLTEIQDWKVLLLEAGDEEPTVAHVPAFANLLRKSSLDWKYETQPEPIACRAFKNKVCPIPRGKVMGGSSTINGLIYMRGNRQDYNDWASSGNPGWSYDEVLPYFKKSEDNLSPELVASSPGYHGTGGYLGVERYPYRDTNVDVVVNAFKELGLPERDPNSAEQIGVSHMQVCARNGVRQSANEAFITPIRANRPNLFVKTNAFVTRVLVNPRTKSAVGVEYSDSERRDIVKRVYASKEVIVSAGAINSPKLLMLSGIGKASELNKFGIQIVAELPVGENLHDHITVTPFIGVIDQSRSTLKSSEEMTNDAMGWLNSYATALSGAGSLLGVAAFVKTSREAHPDVPDVQYFIRTTILDDYAKVPNNFLATSYVPTSYYDAISFGPHLLNMKSRGSVRLNETDPIWGPPLIHSNFFTHPDDLAVVVEGSMIARQLFDTHAFRYNGITQYTVPQEACRSLKLDSPEYYACVAINYSRSGDHSVGTCKMGPVDDPGAVVDSRLRVRGVKALRVVDASIIPSIPRGNINAPVIMIGEKASDLIKEDWINPPERY